MSRNLRNSTVEKSKQLNEKLRRKEQESKRRRFQKLFDFRNKEGLDDVEETLDLATFSPVQDQHLEAKIDESSTSAKDTSEEESNPASSQEEVLWYYNSYNELSDILMLFHQSPQLILVAGSPLLIDSSQKALKHLFLHPVISWIQFWTIFWRKYYRPQQTLLILNQKTH